MSGDGRVPRIWLITGATSGFGRALTEAAVARGDVVVGAARSPDRLGDLIAAASRSGQRCAVRRHRDGTCRRGRGCRRRSLWPDRRSGEQRGRPQVGALEETTDQDLRALFELHFFGPAALTRAVLPHMRRQGSGVVVQMSSVGGQVTAPGFGAYCATKFALEGLTETLSQEVTFGVKFLIVEPGAFRTGLFNPNAAYQSAPMPEYDATVGHTRRYLSTGDGTQPGDPTKATQAILTALDSPSPPLRLVLGSDAVDGTRGRLDSLGTELDRWEALGRATSLDARSL